MKINGVLFFEADPHSPDCPCEGCAFSSDPKGCSMAVHLSLQAFGGDCDDRNVIYVAEQNK
jgi:hypothetical protein